MNGTYHVACAGLTEVIAGLKHKLLLAVIFLFVQSAWASEEYQTTVVLENTAFTNGVDHIIFRWTGVDANDDDRIAKEELNYLEMELFAAAESVWLDVIVDTGAPSPGVQSIACGGRNTAADFEFEFDFVEIELVAYRNVYRPGSDAECYMVSDDTSFPDINVYQSTVTTEIDWENASLAAQAAELDDTGIFGHLATITSLEEDLYIALNAALDFTGLANAEAWIGGIQDKKGKEPGQGWAWVNGEGAIPLNVAVPVDGNYENWLPGTPDNSRGQEDNLTANFNGVYGWNDQDKGVSGYITEFDVAPADVYIWRFIGGALVSSGEADEFEQFTFTKGSIRNIQTRQGEDQGIFNIPAFTLNSEEVAVPGETSGDFCVAPDPREKITSGGSRVFNRSDLLLADLAGTGTCTGPLDFFDDEYDTWEELLAEMDLFIPSNYRGYWGEVALGGQNVKAVWLTVGVVRSTAEYTGPNVFAGFAENLISYENNNLTNPNLPLEPLPECGNNSLDWRPLDLGGTVPAFDEIPNVEGNEMILQTVQCNGSWGITRRTTHVFPVRSDKGGASGGQRIDNLRVQFEGIEHTLGEASFCAADTVIAFMQAALDDAERKFIAKNYLSMVTALEAIARAAHTHTDFVDSLNPGITGFSACDTLPDPDAGIEGEVFGYPANLIGRGLAAAFTGWDRWAHPNVFQLYIPDAVGCDDVIDDPDTAEDEVEACHWAYYGVTKPDLREEVEEE